MGTLFGTDGVRGRAGHYPLDPVTIFRLGVALTRFKGTPILLGRDTRRSGIWIEELLARAVASAGGKTVRVGVITTPGVAFLVGRERCQAGIMISASHNPFQDNGIKIFAASGMKLPEAEEGALEEMVRQGGGPVDHALFTRIPEPESLRSFDRERVGHYIGFLGEAGSPLEGLSVVLDCANGSAFHIAPEVFRRLGASVSPIHCQPDGCNINHRCGSLYPQDLCREVVRRGAALGVAFDGDADRAIFSDESGARIDGDHVLFILACHLKRQGKLASGCVVSTVMANMGLEVALRRQELRMIRTRVGDRYVFEEMARGDHQLGGEQSGHVILRDHSSAGDGILTALKVAEVMRETGFPLSRLARDMRKYPQVLRNVSVRKKCPFEQDEALTGVISRVHQAVAPEGRLLVRYSGTEPLVRIMLEGPDEELISRLADQVAQVFRERLGA